MERRRWFIITIVVTSVVMAVSRHTYASRPRGPYPDGYRGPMPQYGGGAGEPNDPYLVYTAEQLNAIGKSGPMDAQFKLMADIDLIDYGGTKFNIIGRTTWPFRGTFDGNGHAISNFTVDVSVLDDSGLFGVVDDPNAEIRDLRLIDPNICLEAGFNVGALVGCLAGGVIRDCTVEGGQVAAGSVGGDRTGGLVGSNGGGIIGCHASCNVTGYFEVGGLIGKNWDATTFWDRTGYRHNGEVTGCSASGNVRGVDGLIGGLIGHNEGGTVSDCHASGVVSGGAYVGGLVGQGEDGTVQHCHAMGGVDGGKSVGGLIGNSQRDTLAACYATGSVVGEDWVGGMVGSGTDLAISNCYASGTVAGNAYVGGLVGRCDGALRSSFATGATNGIEQVGGLAGSVNGEITSCYARGDVSGGQRVGGLVGSLSMHRSREAVMGVSACYATGLVSGEAYVGGLVGDGRVEGVDSSFWDIESSGQPDSFGGEGVTSAAMRDPNTFMAAGWDFTGLRDGPCNLWSVDTATGLPILWWQAPNAPLPSFAGGSGTAEDPYLVASARQLSSIGHNPRLMEACFTLAEDIDLTGVSFFPIGNSVYPFFGVFDGGGRTVAGFSHVAVNSEHVGFFSYVDGPNARIESVGLADPNIDARTSDHVAALVGHLEQGLVITCQVSGGRVAGNKCVGGLVGSSSETGVIGYSFASCAVLGREDAEATWSPSDLSGQCIGGLAGQNDGLIGGCYADGAVAGNRSVGGLVGSNYGIVRECYATGLTIGNDEVGGLLGYDDDHGIKVIASYWDVETSGQPASAGGWGKTTAEMCTAQTYLRWGAGDTEGLWTIDEGRDYPRLWWQNQPGQTIDVPPLAELVGGTGTADDPYRVYTGADMNWVGVFPREWGKHFKLMADIDLSAYRGTQFNRIGESITPFSGVFDGDGHSIHNFSYGCVGRSLIGLFAYVSGNNAEITNLNLIDPAIDAGPGSLCVGALVAYLCRGSVVDCHVDNASVTGFNGVSALAGYNYEGMIANCLATGCVSGDECVGGLVGYNEFGEVLDCQAAATIIGGDWAGGLIGAVSRGQIVNCRSNGAVSGGDHVGGLVGGIHDYATINACYTGASVVGSALVGGVAGSNTGKVLDCMATGSVSGSSTIGGLVGFNLESNYTLVESCHATGDVTGGKIAGGLVGQNDGVIRDSGATGTVNGEATVGGLAGRNCGRIANSGSSAVVVGGDEVGGLAGVNTDTIQNCFSTGSTSGRACVGGLVGSSWYQIADCYSASPVVGSENIGGLVGLNGGFSQSGGGGHIRRCYASGPVTGPDDAGGLVGKLRYRWEITASFWDVEASGQDDSDGGVGLTTAEMMTAAPFLEAGWDFAGETDNGTDEIWWILEGQDYPRLRWELIEDE